MNLGPYELNQIYTGDARILAEQIPDNSVDLVFCDPVYSNIDDYRWLAETAARVLKPDSACLVYYGIGYLPETLQALSKYLRYEWQYINYLPTLNARGAYKTFSNYRGLVCYQKGHRTPEKEIRDLQVDGFSARNNGHIWAKNLEVIAYYLRAFTRPGDIVADFFCGGGTVPAVAKMLGVNYWACEIDQATADKARQRVELTQAPLFVVQPEQLTLSTSSTL